MKRKEVKKYFNAEAYAKSASLSDEEKNVNKKAHSRHPYARASDQGFLPVGAIFLGHYKNDELHSMGVPTGAISNSKGEITAYGWLYQGYMHSRYMHSNVHYAIKHEANSKVFLYTPLKANWFVYGVNLTPTYNEIL